MKFPNAAKGVKKLFAAEILKIFAYIAMGIALVLGITVLAAGNVISEGGSLSAADLSTIEGIGVGSVIGLAITLIVFFVLILIAFILEIVGLANAKHDEDSFKSALILLLLSFVLSGISSALITVNSVVSSVLSTAASLFSLFVIIFIIAGIVKLADRLNRGDISAKGANILKLIIAVNVLALVAQIVTTILGGMVASVTAAVIMLIVVVLNIVKYFMYLSFLSKTKKMLVEGK